MLIRCCRTAQGFPLVLFDRSQGRTLAGGALAHRAGKVFPARLSWPEGRRSPFPSPPTCGLSTGPRLEFLSSWETRGRPSPNCAPVTRPNIHTGDPIRAELEKGPRVTGRRISELFPSRLC